ncbi:hypothetical protein JCM10908_001738 [Rhodotorula pacifica]|uniref:uncharacterized protein n=1 Tax=Rhodotorula pacifica TaxID=1495444 RepID=UPI003176B10E
MHDEIHAQSPRASFSALPPELQLRILSECDPQSLVRVSAINHAALDIARADSLWRDIALDLITCHRYSDEHAADRTTATSWSHNYSSATPSLPPSPPQTWFEVAAFLLQNAHHLGYFASSQPFTSRVIRIGIVGPAPAQVQPDAPPPRYSIRAAQLVPRNALVNPLVPLSPTLLPFGAVQHALEPGSWLVSPGMNPLHPYAGYSVDFLEPSYDFEADMFDITPEEGACLPRGNSHTREAIAAAALGPAFEQASIYNPQPAPRLRLALEPVSQAVAPSSPSTSRLDPDPTSRSETSPDPMERVELNREALFALFSGRLPRRPWPTAQLVGLDRISTADLPFLRAGRTDPPRNVFRPSSGGGAFRGLEEWLTDRRGGQQPLAKIVEPDFSSSSATRRREAGATDDRAYVTGFRLRAKRTTTRSPAGTEAASNEQQARTSGTAGTGGAAAAGGTPAARRRGVGPDGGMAVLWQGREQDPDHRPPITILRAGDDAQGGFVLRLPGSPPLPPVAPLPLGVHAEDWNDIDIETEPLPAAAAAAQQQQQQQQRHGPRSPEGLADAVDSAAEGFFPIKPPAKPLSWDEQDHTAATDEHGHLLAQSLEGYWVGPYSSHGLEILNLTTGLAEFPASGGAREGSYSDGGDSSDSEDEGVTYRRVITATKVTGDPNVPSGQTSWIAILPAAPMSPHLANLADGPVPSVSAAQFHHLSSLDPTSPSYQGMNNGAGPDWTAGCVRAYGRIALTGYTSPSYSPAEVRFLRHENKIRKPEQPHEERTVETIEEIHVRWLEMHKVTVFKRMRV